MGNVGARPAGDLSLTHGKIASARSRDACLTIFAKYDSYGIRPPLTSRTQTNFLSFL